MDLVGEDGAAILVHHVNRLTASSPAVTEGYSGSTGWHNSVRARWYLYPESETTDEGTEQTGSLVLALQKTNLGRDDQTMRLRWDDDARLFVAEAAVSRYDNLVRDTSEQRGITAAIRDVLDSGGYVPAAAMGPRTAHHVFSAARASRRPR